MKECGFAWNFGPYLSWPPFNCHHFQQWNHCKACAWLHTEDNLIVSCCENGDQAAVWVSRVERWVQPDLLPALPVSRSSSLEHLDVFVSWTETDAMRRICSRCCWKLNELCFMWTVSSCGRGGGLLTIVYCWEQLGGFMTTWVLFKSQTYEHALWIQRTILS